MTRSEMPGIGDWGSEPHKPVPGPAVRHYVLSLWFEGRPEGRVGYFKAKEGPKDPPEMARRFPTSWSSGLLSFTASALPSPSESQ